MEYDVRRFNGTFKGLIAECMFKLTNERCVLTRFFNRNKYAKIFEKYYSQDQINFLMNNWYSIDALEIKFVEKKTQFLLYEIKAKNAYAGKWPHKMTSSTVEMYKNAIALGFESKLVTVWFHDNWKFDVQIEDIEKANWTIDRPKLYDQKREL